MYVMEEKGDRMGDEINRDGGKGLTTVSVQAQSE